MLQVPSGAIVGCRCWKPDRSRRIRIRCSGLSCTTAIGGDRGAAGRGDLEPQRLRPAGRERRRRRDHGQAVAADGETADRAGSGGAPPAGVTEPSALWTCGAAAGVVVRRGPLARPPWPCPSSAADRRGGGRHALVQPADAVAREQHHDQHRAEGRQPEARPLRHLLVRRLLGRGLQHAGLRHRASSYPASSTAARTASSDSGASLVTVTAPEPRSTRTSPTPSIAEISSVTALTQCPQVIPVTV